MTPAIETAIHAFVEANRDAETRFLAEIVKVPSDNPPGDCDPAAAVVAGLLEGLGFTVERHKVPDALAKAAGMASATNLIVRRRFGAGPTIALNAHGDVVPPGVGWTKDPYGAEIVDGWMYGRGAAVSKSDIATYAFALLALERSGAALNGTVELHITYDEESGGEIGPRYILEQGLTKPDLALAAGFSYAVVNAHNGCLHLEVEALGRSAHAAKPFTGVDALEAANAILTALYAWRRGLAARVSAIPGIGSPQMTVGLISGGVNTNVVPDRVAFRLDRRIIPEENPAEVEAELRAVIAEAAKAHPDATVSVRRILLAEPLTPTPAGQALTEALCRHASRVMGEPITAGGVPLYTDARHYAGAGAPISLFGAGPRSIEEANAHRADERLPLADLFKATEIIALTLADLLGAK
jgi:acetylornithine deacetylase/succinyl-diaminopimelate desuccinylase family protein